jgi:hypothetical protein
MERAQQQQQQRLEDRMLALGLPGQLDDGSDQCVHRTDALALAADSTLRFDGSVARRPPSGGVLRVSRGPLKLSLVYTLSLVMNARRSGCILDSGRQL